MTEEQNENSDLPEVQESLQSLNINQEITDNLVDSEANQRVDKQKGKTRSSLLYQLINSEISSRYSPQTDRQCSDNEKEEMDCR